jgi:hypothetical protein
MDRQAVLDALYARIDAGQGVLIAPVRDLADEIGIPSQRLYYLIQAFEQGGALWTRSRGPKGLEIRRSDGAAGAGPAARPQARAGRGRFCPWCGHPAEPGWRFCMSCGKRLPSGSAPAPAPD